MTNRFLHITSLLLLFLVGSASCKKFIEKEKQKAATSIITDGTWRVSRYQAGDSDLTAGFSGYRFQFKENGTVDAVLGSETRYGSWSVDVNARTILSSFPENEVPVSLLNQKWKITDSYNDSVSANSQPDSVRYLLELHKN